MVRCLPWPGQGDDWAAGRCRDCRVARPSHHANYLGPIAYGRMAMLETQLFHAGNFRFVTHAFQYSGGVEALEGYAIERARFVKPLKLAEGFAAAEAHMARMGRPPTAFCACELRSPGQFTDQGFVDFNRHYVQQLADWGLFHDDINPVARSNVCPEIDPPSEPSLYAFCYTVPGRAGFVVAGSGEAGGAEGPYGPRIIRLGDT